MESSLLTLVSDVNIYFIRVLKVVETRIQKALFESSKRVFVDIQFIERGPMVSAHDVGRKKKCGKYNNFVWPNQS